MWVSTADAMTCVNLDQIAEITLVDGGAQIVAITGGGDAIVLWQNPGDDQTIAKKVMATLQRSLSPITVTPPS